MRHTRAFTLIELVVVLAVLGLLAAAAAVKFHGLFGRTRLQAAARGLGDHFALAVRRAYVTGGYHTLVFDLETGRYWIKEGRRDEEGRSFLMRRLVRGVSFADIQVGGNLYVPPGTLSVEISPLGVTNDLLVNLQDSEGGEAAVWLNALVQSVEYFSERKNFEDFKAPSAF